MLTSRDRLEDKLQGFEAGVDDYLTKPFELRELEARIHVLHKRWHRQPLSVLRVADLTLDCASRCATRQGEPLNLPPASYRLLEALMRNSPHVMRYAELVLALWGDAEHDQARLHTHISRCCAAWLIRPFKQPLILTVNGSRSSHCSSCGRAATHCCRAGHGVTAIRIHRCLMAILQPSVSPHLPFASVRKWWQELGWTDK